MWLNRPVGPRGCVRGRCSRSGMLAHPCNAVTTRHVVLSRLFIDIDMCWQLVVLNLGLRRCHAVHVLPIYQAFLIVVGVCGGGEQRFKSATFMRNHILLQVCRLIQLLTVCWLWKVHTSTNSEISPLSRLSLSLVVAASSSSVSSPTELCCPHSLMQSITHVSRRLAK